MGTLILYAALSIFFSFLCSILEAVLLSVTPTFINVKKNEGKTFATELENLKEDIDKPLIAILTLNTIAHTVGAILVGVQAEQLPYKFEIFGINMVGIISAIMTILILVVSEIIPKTIGATYWKNLTNFTAKTLKILIFPLKWTGILWLLQLTTKLIGGENAHGKSILREDFYAMTDIAHEEGVFQKSEKTIIKNLLNFKNIKAKQIMTPRSVLIIADESQSIQEYYHKNKKLPFSRIPLYSNKNVDVITGYFLKDDLLLSLVEGQGHKPLNSIKREITIADRNTSIPELFKTLVEKHEHLALIVDEYGSVNGLVTQEDVLETLLGFEIIDESDSTADLQHLAKHQWKLRSKKLDLLDNKETEH